MVQDLSLMKDVTPLFEREVVIWGAGYNGKRYAGELLEMGAGKHGLIFCDSNPEKKGFLDGIRVILPEELKELVKKKGEKNVVLIISAEAPFVTDEILARIAELEISDMPVYTKYGIDMGICLNLHAEMINERFRAKKQLWLIRQRRDFLVEQFMEAMRYFDFLPYHESPVLVYQPGKVGSTSVYQSIQENGGYVLHTHALRGIAHDMDDLKRILNKKSAKIISCVRDPIARQISAIWEKARIDRLLDEKGEDIDYRTLIQDKLTPEWAEGQFRWFEHEMKATLGIDIYKHPFDREKGYTIIKEDNITLLLYKMERIAGLRKIIGEFAGIDSFEIKMSNAAREKPYRFAYRQFKKEAFIPKGCLDYIYRGNFYTDHFYTEEEREQFYRKWKEYTV